MTKYSMRKKKRGRSARFPRFFKLAFFIPLVQTHWKTFKWCSRYIVSYNVLMTTYAFYLMMTDKLIIINSKAFRLKNDSILHAQLSSMTPWAGTMMATRGIASSTPGVSSFSASGNSFSIKNILSLSDETVQEQKWISKDGAPVNMVCAPCLTPPLLVAPRVMFPPEYHRPFMPSCLQAGNFCIPPFRPVALLNPCNFPAHTCFPGK